VYIEIILKFLIFFFKCSNLFDIFAVFLFMELIMV
jgi:hypothetical protein